MLLLKVILIGIFASVANCISDCGTCPSECEFGLVYTSKKNECTCSCAPNPCQRKRCSLAEVCQVRPKEICHLGTCKEIKIAVCTMAQCPKIVDLDRNIQLEQGASLNLQARVENDENAEYTWTKDGLNLPTNVVSNGALLTADMVDEQNEGTYKLVVRNQGCSDQAEMKLRVYKKPVEIVYNILIKEDIKLEVQANQSFNLICRITNTFRFFSWSRVNDRLPNHIVKNQERLQFKNIRLSDAGTYKCTASSSTGQNEVKVTIQVSDFIDGYNTLARIYNQDVTLREDQDLTIMTLTSAFPFESSEWLMNGHETIDANRARTIDGKTFTFEMENNRREGEYRYRMTSANAQTIEEITNVFIEKSPMPEPEPEPEPSRPEVNEIEGDLLISDEQVEVNEGDRAEVRCQFYTRDGRPSDMSISWAKEGGRLPPNVQQRGTVLLIDEAKSTDSGVYTCTLEQKPDKFMRRLNVRVNRVEPAPASSAQSFPLHIRLLEPSNANSFRVNLRVVVECLALIEEDVKEIIWSKQDGHDRSRKETTGNNSTLTFRALTSIDLGKYVCIAVRRNGQKSQNGIQFSRSADNNQIQIKIDHVSDQDYYPENQQPEQRPQIQPTPHESYEPDYNRPQIQPMPEPQPRPEQRPYESIDDRREEARREETRREEARREEARREEARREEARRQEERRQEERRQEERRQEERRQEARREQERREETRPNYYDPRYRPQIQPQPEPQPQPQPQPTPFQPITGVKLVPIPDRNMYEVRSPYEHVGEPEVIVTGRQERKIEEDESIVLEYTVHNADMITIAKNDEDLPAGTFVEKDNDVFRIHMFNLRRRDTGYYTVLAKNRYAVARGHVHLYVGGCLTAKKKPNVNRNNLAQLDERTRYYRQAPKVTILKEAPVIYLTQGQTYILSCEVLGSESVKLSKVNDTEQKTYRKIAKIADIWKFEIHNVQPSSSGLYQCTADNFSGISTDFVHLEVEPSREVLPPQPEPQPEPEPQPREEKLQVLQSTGTRVPRALIRKKSEVVTLNEGDTYAIDCVVSKTNNVQIDRFNDPLPKSHKFEKISNTQYKLFLYNLKPSDGGYYYCVATNEYGQDRCLVFLDIKSNGVDNEPENRNIDDQTDNNLDQRDETTKQSAPAPAPAPAPVDDQSSAPPTVTINSEKEIELFEGESIELECVTLNGEITEFGKYGEDPADFSLDKISSHKQKLKVLNLIEQDTGYYICNAENKNGQNRDYTLITVKKKQQ